MRGRFITFEGIDGAGKSSHVDQLQQYLATQGIDSIVTREPGGTPLGEQLRALLLSEKMHPQTEVLLAFAARVEHLHQIIWPALEKGQWVISDRFTEASYAYQGGGRELGNSAIASLETWCQGTFRPDLTFVFDLPPSAAKDRINGRELDKFEEQDNDFFNRVRASYLALAKDAPQRFYVIDAQATQAVIAQTIQQQLHSFFKEVS